MPYFTLRSHIHADGVIKRKGRAQYYANPDAPFQPAPAAPSVASAPTAPPTSSATHQSPSPLVHSLAGSAVTGGIGAPPDAPRKSAAKPAYLQQESQQSMEDIEDSFQDTTTSPHPAKQPIPAYQRQPLQLKRGRDEPAIVTGCSKASASTAHLEVCFKPSAPEFVSHITSKNIISQSC